MYVQFTYYVQGVNNPLQCHVSVWMLCLFRSLLSAFNLNNRDTFFLHTYLLYTAMASCWSIFCLLSSTSFDSRILTMFLISSISWKVSYNQLNIVERSNLSNIYLSHTLCGKKVTTSCSTYGISLELKPRKCRDKRQYVMLCAIWYQLYNSRLTFFWPETPKQKLCKNTFMSLCCYNLCKNQ